MFSLQAPEDLSLIRDAILIPPRRRRRTAGGLEISDGRRRIGQKCDQLVQKFQARQLVPGHVRARGNHPTCRKLDVPVRGITSPTRIKQLYVPRQGVGVSDLNVGCRKFRDFVNPPAGTQIAPEGYKAARDIITVDCSLRYMLAYVGNSAQRVGILTRRSVNFAPSFIWRLKAFSAITAFEMNALVREWVPDRPLHYGRGSFGEMDFSRTWQILCERRMISSDTPWPALTDEQREADLTRLNTLHGLIFNPLDENLALQKKKAAAKAV